MKPNCKVLQRIDGESVIMIEILKEQFQISNHSTYSSPKIVTIYTDYVKCKMKTVKFLDVCDTTIGLYRQLILAIMQSFTQVSQDVMEI